MKLLNLIQSLCILQILLLLTIKAVEVEEFCKDVSLAANTGNQLGGTNTNKLASTANTNTDVVKSMQEWRGENRLMKVLKKEENMQTYGAGIGSYAAWGIFFAVVTFLCCVCTNLGRLCRCKCCFKPSKVYTKKEKLTCVVVYTVFAIACGICCILGLVALTGFVNGLSDILCVFEEFRIASLLFFNTMLQPLNNLKTTGVTNINYIDSNLGPADVVGNDADEVIGLFQNYSSDVGNINVHPNYTCAFCQGVASDSNQTVKEMKANVKPGVAEMEGTATTLNVQLVGANLTIIGVVNAAAQSTTFLFDFIKGPWKEMIKGTMTNADPIRGQIITMGSMFFGVAFIVMSFTAIGIFFELCGKYTNCTKIKCIDTLDDKLGAWFIYFAWCFSFIFIIFLFVICAILLPLGVVVSDACVLIEDMPHPSFEGTLGPHMGNMKLAGTTPAGILDGCFKNGSLFDILNMTSSFSFKDSLSFGGSDNFNSTDSFSFSKFDAMHAKVHSLTYKNFSAPGTSIDDDIANAEALGQTQVANELKTVKNNSIKTVAWMKKDIDHIQYKMNLLQNLTVKFQTDLAGSKPYANAIVDSAMLISEGGNCVFIKTQYYNVGEALCGDFLVSVLQLALYSFLAGIFGFPMIFANLKINQRFGGHGEFKEGEEEDGEEYGPVRGLTFQKMKTNIFGGGKGASTVPVDEDQPQESSEKYVVADETGMGENAEQQDEDFV